MTEITTTGFDYGTLDAETRIVVQQKTGEIHERVDTLKRSAIEIGQRLTEVKAKLPYGFWGKWLETEFSWSDQTALNFINIARMAGEIPNYLESEDRFATTALIALAAPGVPHEARETALDRAAAGEHIGVKQAQTIIGQAKAVGTPKFRIGQRVRHNGLIYDVSGFTSGGNYSLTTIAGKTIQNIPGVEIEPVKPALDSEPKQRTQPSAASLPKLGFRDLVRVKGELAIIISAMTQGDKYLRLEALFVSGIRNGILNAKRIDPAETVLVEKEAVSKQLIANHDKLRAFLETYGTDEETHEHSAAEPEELYVGDWVQTRIGRIGQIVEINGAHAIVETEIGRNPHKHETLIKIDPPTPKESKPPTKGEQLKAQLVAANIHPIKVVAHLNGNAGTYTAAFNSDGTHEQATEEARSYAALIRAAGFQILDVGADIPPGSQTLGIGGENTPMVYFADESYEVPQKPVAPEQPLPEAAPDPVEADPTNDEWYTPPNVMEWIKAVLGTVDLDPASCAAANLTVGASAYFSRKEDGLARDWHGRVFLNPPYSFPAVADFAEKLLSELEAGRVEEAIVLVNNRTDAGWFQELLEHADMTCFLIGRINFLRPGKELPGNRQGQAALYFGAHVSKFTEVFSERGALVQSAGVVVS